MAAWPAAFPPVPVRPVTAWPMPLRPMPVRPGAVRSMTVSMTARPTLGRSPRSRSPLTDSPSRSPPDRSPEPVAAWPVTGQPMTGSGRVRGGVPVSRLAGHRPVAGDDAGVLAGHRLAQFRVPPVDDLDARLDQSGPSKKRLNPSRERSARVTPAALSFSVAAVSVLRSRAAAWAGTTGSLSQWTTRASGAICCATWCRWGSVGMPVPMSRNCRTPCPASQRVARCMKARSTRAITGTRGSRASICRPISSSTG
jgi:hypothetical protein